MRLTGRLLLSSLLVVGALVVFILAVVDLRLRDGLVREARTGLEREARTIAALWSPAADAQRVAADAGRALGHRVTLLALDGTPIGDSEQPIETVGAAGDLRGLPEVAGALRDGVGWDATDAAPGGDALRIAVRAPHGIVRVTHDLSSVAATVGEVRGGLLAAGGVAMLVAAVLAWVFARDVTRPLLELRDVARGLAAGDLSRRPSLTAPGEVGDVADALHRLAEQLDSRLDALKAEESLRVALLDALLEGVVTLNRRQQVIRINETARQLLAVRAAPPFALDLLPRERALRDAVASALDGEATDAVEAFVGGRTLLVAARPLPDGGAVLAVYDLTPVRRLEGVRRDFVANVSHELRTPLTVVGGFAETLADDDLPPEQRRRFAETIRTNAVRMQRIVDDLLDLSRIESGGWVPKPEQLAVRTVAAEAIAAAASAAARSGVTLAIEIAPRAESAWVDPTALRQMLGNLVDNAVRHTPSGLVVVFAEPAPAGAVAVGVRDTGIGIPPEHLPRIFERFYRVDPARSRDAGGTGLGLAIVRHLVEAHGGRVRAESAPGRGTTIVATFPPAPDAPATPLPGVAGA